MAETELDAHLEEIKKRVRENMESGVGNDSIEKVEPDDIPEPTISTEMQKLLNERRDQRKKIFSLSVTLTSMAFIFLLVMIGVQAIIRLDDQDFSFFNGHELEVLSVSIFGQIIGLIYIIAKALWDDSNYIDSIK